MRKPVRSRKTSVTTAVIAALLTISTLTLAVLGMVSYHHQRQRELEYARGALRLDADQIAPSLEWPVRNSDRPQINQIVESMLLDPILTGIVVVAADRKTVLCAREWNAQGAVTEAKELSASGLLVERREIRFENEVIATVTLFGSTRLVDESMKGNLRWILYNILWVDLLLCLGTYLLLHHWVFKPLQKVEAYAAAVSAGGEAEKVRPFRGEIESLRSSIEKMFELLNTRYLELQDSEEKFSKAFQSNPSGIVITETETGRCIEVNESFCRMVGYASRDLVGRTSLEMGVWENPEERKRIMESSLTGGSVRNEEIEARTRAGLLRTFSLNAEPIELGGKRCIVTLVEDVTERKLDIATRRQAEAKLRDEKAMSDTVINGLPGVFYIFDEQGRLVRYNAEFAKVAGITHETVAAHRLLDLVIDEDKEQAAAAVRQAYGGGQASVEARIATANGLRDFHFVARTLQVEGQTCLIGSGYDITERRRSEARLRRLVESDVQGVIFWNMRGKITEANDAFLRIVGYTRDDLNAGRINWVAMTPLEYGAQDERVLKELAATGICKSQEKEFIRKDGSHVSVLVGAALFGEGSEEGVAFVLDLSERKQLEQQLLRSQRMESIGTLAGGIAHDLNNALSPIMMSLTLLEMRFPDPESQQLLAMLSASAHRGADMVRQVLSFARGMEGRRMEVQIKHLVKEIKKIARDTFLKQIEISTSVPASLWTVVGDPTQLHQVLLNLCVNARDAMPGGGALTISAENVALDEHYAALNPEAHPGPYVCLHVEDTGTGIPPGVLEKIFDPFFTTKELGKGTGLGLSTTLGIVKSHGGFLQVYSEPGHGTKFHVFLPAETEFRDEAAEEATAELPRGHGELILVVDDESSVRQITRQTLEACGYRVSLATNGSEALTAYATHGPEIAVVLTDMTMPVMNGPELIEVLQKLNPALPIIAASGLAAGSQAASSSVARFLLKPFTAETLLHALAQVLKE